MAFTLSQRADTLLGTLLTIIISTIILCKCGKKFVSENGLNENSGLTPDQFPVCAPSLDRLSPMRLYFPLSFAYYINLALNF